MVWLSFFNLFQSKNISFCKTSPIRFGTDILFKSIYCLEPVMNIFFYFLFYFFISLVFSFKLVSLKLFFEAVFQRVVFKKHSKFNILHVRETLHMPELLWSLEFLSTLGLSLKIPSPFNCSMSNIH